MSNMSYCRFRNTVEDVEDCIDNWDSDQEEIYEIEQYNRDADEDEKEEIPVTSREELQAQLDLLNQAEQIIELADEDCRFKKNNYDQWELA